MGSSKFATPFFKKSPLNGAYTSGAGGAVTISDAPHFAKLQEDALAIANPQVDKCAMGAEYYFDKDGAKMLCNNKEDETTIKGIRLNQSITDQATEAEFEDNMADINSTEGFLESEEKKDAAKLKQQKKSAANIISNFQGFSF